MLILYLIGDQLHERRKDMIWLLFISEMLWEPVCRGWSIEAQVGRAGVSGEIGGEEAERLALVGGQRRAVALEISRYAATGGTRAVAEGLDAALPLQLWEENERKHEHAPLWSQT